MSSCVFGSRSIPQGLEYPFQMGSAFHVAKGYYRSNSRFVRLESISVSIRNQKVKLVPGLLANWYESEFYSRVILESADEGVLRKFIRIFFL